MRRLLLPGRPWLLHEPVAGRRAEPGLGRRQGHVIVRSVSFVNENFGQVRRPCSKDFERAAGSLARAVLLDFVRGVRARFAARQGSGRLVAMFDPTVPNFVGRVGKLVCVLRAEQISGLAAGQRHD